MFDPLSLPPEVLSTTLKTSSYSEADRSYCGCIEQPPSVNVTLEKNILMEQLHFHDDNVMLTIAAKNHLTFHIA